jgi:alkaline phosphatase D
MKHVTFFVLSTLLAGISVTVHAHFANGIKIGEVDQHSAIVWTRLTLNPTLNVDGAAFLDADKLVVPPGKQLPEGKELADMIGAVPGKAGSVRMSWRKEGEAPIVGKWMEVGSNTDYTCRTKLKGLEPETRYLVRVESKDGASFEGSFRTAPSPKKAKPVTFAVVTGQDFPRRDDGMNGHKIYPLMDAMDLDFFVHTGDIEYYDKPFPYATNLEFARWKMARIYGLPNQVEFHRDTASYFIKDDHDTTKNDSYPKQSYGNLTWDQGLELFREHFPVLEKNYRTIRWGKDLQVWFVEGRDFRTPNNEPDGPEKSIWGKEQKKWFFQTVKQSDATFRVLVSPTPVVGPDRGKKNDNHANVGFKHEGDEIRKFIAGQDNMYVACGDRHWQYVSVDEETGVKEFSCGPTSMKHASGWSNDNVLPEHRYLNVQGGFLTLTVERRKGKAVLISRHYDVDGKLCNEDVNWAE